MASNGFRFLPPSQNSSVKRAAFSVSQTFLMFLRSSLSDIAGSYLFLRVQCIEEWNIASIKRADPIKDRLVHSLFSRLPFPANGILSTSNHLLDILCSHLSNPLVFLVLQFTKERAFSIC